MEKVERVKKKQRPKKGKVVRLNEDLAIIVESEQREGETISEVMRRLFGYGDEIRFALPSDLFESIEDARGAAVVKKVRMRSSRAERPLPVRVRK